LVLSHRLDRAGSHIPYLFSSALCADVSAEPEK